MPDPKRPHPTRATAADSGRPWWEEDLDGSGLHARSAGTLTDGRAAGRPTGILPDRDRRPGPAPTRTGSRGPGGSGRPPHRRSTAGPLFPLTRRDRLRRTLLLAGAALCTLVLSGLLLAYGHLNANLRSSPLFAGLSGDAGSEKPDPFGREPINVLLIGSDTRATAADCQLGGGCADGGAGANADVEMVVHVAADRSNATVMSVPRDTMTDLPACTTPTGGVVPARHGQINSTLAHGPGCTVAAVHHLTGIPIDHFVMVDFAGVIAMSDAVGGAQICVSGNVYDNYSHLKLTQGTHTLTGLAALEFVRSRHAFGDGSDLGRTYAQHLFLSAVIRSLKSAGTLANPARLYALADAATKALTVDTALASIPNLIGLATDLDKVPPHRITFTTMQTTPDPADPNRVVPAPAARRLFDLITADQPLTGARTAGTGPGGAGAASTPAAGSAAGPSQGPTLNAATRARTVVRVQNATGRTGRAATIAQTLIGRGFSPRSTSTTAPTAAVTTLDYGTGQLTRAQAVAQALGLPASALHQAAATGITLTIGTDWPSGTTYPAGGTDPVPAPAVTALAQAHAQTADTTGTCAPVSTQATVTYNGTPMTPAQAFQRSTDVPLSAP
ncbi:MAG TPA: LCP family protein [Kineosporiaceae bacterium]|nr:LCP family protein [Kineosporiaceae bacterium]